MRLSAALHIDLKRQELISFVGAGGKTTALFALAQELAHAGKSVLATTTTAICYPDEKQCHRVLVCPDFHPVVEDWYEEATVTCLGLRRTPDDKLLGISPGVAGDLFVSTRFDYVLVEADGSKSKPLKAPAPHEPVVPAATTILVGVIGLDALGKAISAVHVHRPETFCAVTRKSPGDIIDEAAIAAVVCSAQGLFKSAPRHAAKYVIFNQADNGQLQKAAGKIIELVLESNSGITGYVVASLRSGTIVTAS